MDTSAWTSEMKLLKIKPRKPTPKEKADAQIKLYSPCACGSGKKFKFCCRRNRE